MFTRKRLVAALVGAGLAVTPVATANAAGLPSWLGGGSGSTAHTYVEVTLTGQTCNSVLWVKQKLNHTKITLASQNDNLGNTYDYWGGSTTHTYAVDTHDVTPIWDYVQVQTWCGHGPFQSLMGKSADNCWDSTGPTAEGGLGTKQKPYKVTVDMDLGIHWGNWESCG